MRLLSITCCCITFACIGHLVSDFSRLKRVESVIQAQLSQPLSVSPQRSETTPARSDCTPSRRHTFTAATSRAITSYAPRSYTVLGMMEETTHGRRSLFQMQRMRPKLGGDAVLVESHGMMPPAPTTNVVPMAQASRLLHRMARELPASFIRHSGLAMQALYADGMKSTPIEDRAF